MPVRQITLCRCNKFDRQENISGLAMGATVRLVRQDKRRDDDVEEMPMLAFREGGLDIGEVPTTIAASIIGNEHTATVIGFVQRARWTAPVISVETKPAERSPRSKPETIRYNIVLSAPVMAHRRERIRTPFQAPKQTGPSAGQIAVLIVIVIAASC